MLAHPSRQTSSTIQTWTVCALLEVLPVCPAHPHRNSLVLRLPRRKSSGYTGLLIGLQVMGPADSAGKDHRSPRFGTASVSEGQTLVWGQEIVKGGIGYVGGDKG